MILLKHRITPLQSKNKVIIAMNLFEKYVDEPIETIIIWNSTHYFINNKWDVNIQDNKVEKYSPDIEY